MKLYIRLLIFLLLFLTSSFCFAQDDLSALLDSASHQREYVNATFKSTRIINIQSSETVPKHVLDFRVTHRFGAIGSQSGGTKHNLYGLDESTDIRIAFEYGITDKLTAGVARHKYDETYEALGKFRLLQQTNDNHIPVAITLFSNISYIDEDNPLIDYDSAGSSITMQRRIAYCSQVIIARKFSSRFSLELIPTVVHRNFIDRPDDTNTLYAVGAGGRIKITHSMAFIADYMYNLGSYRKPGNNNDLYNVLGAGMEFETGGHVFSLMFTNAASILEKHFVSETTDSWGKGGFRFSFNISRNFRL